MTWSHRPATSFTLPRHFTDLLLVQWLELCSSTELLYQEWCNDDDGDSDDDDDDDDDTSKVTILPGFGFGRVGLVEKLSGPISGISRRQGGGKLRQMALKRMSLR